MIFVQTSYLTECQIFAHQNLPSAVEHQYSHTHTFGHENVPFFFFILTKHVSSLAV